jgi:hypothetical protein
VSYYQAVQARATVLSSEIDRRDEILTNPSKVGSLHKFDE